MVQKIKRTIPVNSYRTKNQSDDLNNQNEELINKFTQTMEGMKTALQKQTTEIKTIGQTTPETAKEIKNLTELLEGMQQKNEEIAKKHEELFVRMNRPGQGSNGEPQGVKLTPGEAFTASKSYEQMLASKGYNSAPVNICGLNNPLVETAFKTGDFSQLQGAEFKGLKRFMEQFKALTSAEGSMGAVIIPQRIPGIFGPQERPQHIRDLMTVSSTSSNAIEYIEETGYVDIQTALTAGVASASTNVPVENRNGFFPGQTVRLVEDGVTTVETKVQSITAGSGDAGTVVLTAAAGETFTAAAILEGDRFAATPEGNRAAPEGNIKTAKKTVSVKDISKALTVTRQLMMDAPQLRSYIDSRVMAEGEINLDWHLLYGSGTGDELQGIMTHTGVQSITQGGSDTKLDVIRKSYTKCKKAEYPVNALILSPDDVEDIELIKGTDDKYIMMMMNNGQVWRVPYVETNAIQAGKFVSGNLNLAATLYDREQAQIRSSDSHSDFFTRQLVALLYTMRLANVLTRPEAICVGEFT